MTDPFVEYVREPSRQRLSRFIVAYTEPVTRLVLRPVRCPEASGDVVQEVFLRLAEADSRAAQTPQPRAYVLRTALNVARNHLRRESLRIQHEQAAGRLRRRASPSAEDEVSTKEAVERLYKSIDQLPETLRVAMHLRAVDGLSYKEIAAVTGVSTGTVGARIQKARARLREVSGDTAFTAGWAHFETGRRSAWFPPVTDGRDDSYPGPVPTEVARLRARIAETPPRSESFLTPALAPVVGRGELTVSFESGGDIWPPTDPRLPFSPATEITGGTVSVLTSRAFLRGDSEAA